jgi:hypothetical protein
MEEIKVRYNSRRLIERLGKKPKGKNTYKKMNKQDPEKPDMVMVLIILAAIMVTMLIALW